MKTVKVQSPRKFKLKQTIFVSGVKMVFNIEDGKGEILIEGEIDPKYLVNNVLKPLTLTLVEETEEVKKKVTQPKKAEQQEETEHDKKIEEVKEKEEKEEKPTNKKKKKNTKKKK